MKKAILTSFSILCLSLILFVMECKISVSASPSTIEVQQGSTIQEAINHANPGDTIFVYSGTYNENIVINKSVSLVGENRDSTIINGSGTGDVITVFYSSYISIHGFTIRNSGSVPFDSGIHIELSKGNDISHNKIVNNNCGITLYLSRNNVVSDNAIYSNFNYGIYLWVSSSNIIYHNNFFNNIQQAWSDSINVWSSEGEGNYWSDYTGRDLNVDGIGDTFYAISAYYEDKYPLMGMFSDFNVTLKRETYHVTVVSNSTISDFRFEVGNETGNKIIRFNATGKESTIGFSRVTIPTELMSYPFIVLVGEEEVIPTLYDVSGGTYAHLCFTYIHSNCTITIISSKTLHLYNELLDKYIKLQIDLNTLNATYYDLLDNYSQLQESYQELSNSYQEYLLDYSENAHNIRNLTYIFAAITAIFIITTIYLSKTRAHTLSYARF